MRNSLVGVLTRFRMYKYALISDIRKLYYQCLVDKNDQDFLRFLWYKNNDPSQPIVPCRMTRLSFGLLCAQSAALFCLEKALTDNDTKASIETILMALRSFYVDDGLFSFDNEESLLLFYEEIIPLLNSRGFPLTKFFSNSKKLQSLIAVEDLMNVKTLNFKDEIFIQGILGMVWDVDSDCFKFVYRGNDDLKKANTRRGTLSVYSSIFDPLGFIQPFILKPKLLIQELSRVRCGWDEKIPEKVELEWQTWQKEISKIMDYLFPRCIIPNANYTKAELHVFADSSKLAYASVCYGRFVFNDGLVIVRFIFGKCKICPSDGSISIPRLELVAASLAARISKKMIEELDIKFDDVFYYSDSISTLQLINNTSRRFGVFVDGRLAEIRENSPINRWQYCKSEVNPADVGTRCIRPKSKNQFLLWIEGPKFLQQSKIVEPQIPPECSLTVSNVTINAFCDIKTEFKVEKLKSIAPLMHYYSDFNKLLRAVCYILRVFCTITACVKTNDNKFISCAFDRCRT